MPRKRERQTPKGSWTLEDLRRATQLVNNGISLRKAAKQCGIPYQTFQKRLKKNKLDIPAKLGRNAVFTKEQEENLVAHLIKLSKMFYGLTGWQLRRLAFESAERLKINHPFNKETRLAGKDWMEGFLRRNGNLSFRKAEATSLNRIKGFNKDEVSIFFQNLQTVLTKHKFDQNHVYNMDETGISVVHNPNKVIAQKGQKRVGAATSAERGKNITVICAMSASGNYIPPFFIFPRKRHSPLLEKDGPPGALYHVTPSGWTNDEMFLLWLKHFAHYTNAQKDKSILLILDNHCSHATLAAYNLCRENNITILSFPPHSSHRMQPLDVTFFGPLKKAYHSKCDSFMKSKHLSQITVYDVASLFNKAYSRIASIEKAVSGFRSTGIFPLQPNIFTDEDFLLDNSTPIQVVHETSQQTREENESPNKTPRAQSPRAGCSTWLDGNGDFSCLQTSLSPVRCSSPPEYDGDSISHNETQPPNCSKKQEKSTSMVEILNKSSPLPETQVPAKKRARAKQHSTILTITPMKIVLEGKEQKKQEKKEKQDKIEQNKNKNTNKNAKIPTKAKKKARVKRQVFKDSSDEEHIHISDKDLCDDRSDNGDESDMCFICYDSGKTGELWYRCTACGRWVHADCSGVDTAKDYLCDFCLKKII